MRFGMFIPQGWRHDLVGIDPAEQWQTMKDVVTRADAGDWDSAWVYDHFHTVPVATEEATHEAWTLMSAFAASTSRIRLGQMCTCMSYRNPAYLAKVAATIDVISGGRLEMGIGGGWYEHEWRAYGYGFPRTGERLARLDEGVQIMQQAWRTGTATLDGTHYQVDGAIVRPLPLQAGGIPMWVAGGGEKVTLRIAAKYADYTNFDGSPDGFDHKSRVLRQHCAAEGTDFNAITRTSNYFAVVGSSQADVDQRLRRIEERLLPVLGHEQTQTVLADYRKPTSQAVGTPEQIVDRLSAMKEKGLEYAIFYIPEAAYDTSGMEMLERDVLPQLR